MSIKSQKEFINSLDNATYKSIKEQSDTYAQHLKSFLRTYTDGELHARVIQTDYDEVMELMREVIYKGRNRNPNRLIDLKAKPLAAPSEQGKRPRQDSDEWRHTKNDCGRGPETQDGRRDDANDFAEDHGNTWRT